MVIETRSVFCGLVSGVGLLLVAFEIRHTAMMQTVLGQFLEAIVPLILALFLVYAGYWLYTSSFDASGVARVTIWVFAGMAILALTTTWVISHQFIRGGAFDHAPFVVVNTTTVGGLVGFVTGVYDVRGRALAIERGNLESEQQKLQFVNSVLRHNILNSMNIVLGQTELLREKLSVAHYDALDVIETHGRNIVTHIENVRHYTRIASEEDVEMDLTAVNLSRILAGELESARTTYPDAVISGNVPDDVYVVADELVVVLVENLLANAVEHNVEATPRVTVSLEAHEETARLSVHDNGPGIPASRVEEVFSWGTDGRGNEATGVGLALTNVLVQRYDGEIQFEAGEGNGTVVTISLPRARERAVASSETPDDGGSSDRGIEHNEAP